MSEQIEYRKGSRDGVKVEFRLDADTGSGTFEGYMNYWNTRDSYDTEWHPGAWSRAGIDAANPLQDMHAVNSYTRDTLGMISVAEDERGLVIQRGAFASTQAGQDARALAHLAAEFGQPAELSVGFKRILTADQDDEVRIDDPNVFTVTKFKEGSLIIPHFASQPGASLSSVRAQADVLRTVTDSSDLLDPRTEARIIDMMTDDHGRKRQLVVRVGWEPLNERGGEVHPDSVGVVDPARPLTVANPGEAPPILDPTPVSQPLAVAGEPVTEATSAVVPPMVMTDPDGTPTAEGEVEEDLPTSTENLNDLPVEGSEVPMTTGTEQERAIARKKKIELRLRLMEVKK